MRHRYWAAVLSAIPALALSIPAFAQTSASSSAGTGTSSGSGTTSIPAGGGSSRPPISSPTAPANARTTMPEMRRSIYLQGKVMLEDGGPPPDAAVIELVCKGQSRPQAYTDRKGRFSFELGQNAQAIMADASYGAIDHTGNSRGLGGSGGLPGMPGYQGYSDRDLLGCALRAVLSGYRSEPIPLSDHRASDRPDVGTFVLRRLANVQGFTYSMTSAAAPKEAKRAFEKGEEFLRKANYAGAETQFARAVEIYPRYAAAWNDLGLSQAGQKKITDARRSLEQSALCDNHYVKPVLELAQLAFLERNWPEVIDYTNRAVRLDPYSHPGAYLMSAVANFESHKLDAAEKSARDGLKVDPDHRQPKLGYVLGVVLARKGQFPAALEQLKWYLSVRPNAPDAGFVKAQMAEIEKEIGATQAASAR